MRQNRFYKKIINTNNANYIDNHLHLKYCNSVFFLKSSYLFMTNILFPAPPVSSTNSLMVIKLFL
ncbi:hypothetical protein XBJ2_1340003 [Xenorhabdus bovienii str. Jollieti]|uniref:Uncharacterized protein n=1 Tax=Xenorhabdus bovienii (strain SS-2004) TaxID=406818 RepID=D3V7C1_XENBS|nr:hypothetical protein XBJ1_2609 [Xenorhabdus bovienii SS-2004]CDH27617.1 hypothetical protein XBJ2_1340003 [Xenorhabdus bovienii str. Jollieti]